MKYLISIIACLLMSISVQAQTEKADTVFFELTDSTMMIFPREYIEKWDEDNRYINLTLAGDTVVTIAKLHIKSQSEEYQLDRPQFQSYKFNNKFNDQLYTDAIGEIDNANGTIKVAVGCIGKRLTPSFQLPEGANAYINGKLQHSKETRLRFDTIVHYTVAYPKQYIYKIIKTKDEVWSNPEASDEEWLTNKVDLTEDMLSTNAPSNNGENLINMLDGNHDTFFHSTWGNGEYTKLNWFEGAYYGDGESEWPYIDIQLNNPLSRLQFEYTTRNMDGYCPLGLILQASNDGLTWNEIQTLDSDKDGLPLNPNETYLSPVIDLGSEYTYLRLIMTASQKKNYLVFSEFALYEIEENPDYQKEEATLISPAEYIKGFVPFGFDYDVEVDFLTDHPTSEYNVPRIDITFDDGVSWDNNVWIGRYGKEYYEDATIKIDGVGVFPDMPETPILIRGRGNSSWSGSSNSKNPYRIKFEEKMKPFGLTKGKSWVLLSNKQSGSMTTNAIAMKLADMVETAGCNHIIPVELYINGHYRGSYNFTEKIGFSNNSIDIEDETNAVMLELDSYYDEAYKFRDNTYNLYVNLKEPDLEESVSEGLITKDEAKAKLEEIKTAFNNFTYDIRRNYDNALLDISSVVRAMLVTDLVRNEELMHPKSWFIYNADIYNDSLWVLGPVWDFDWSFGYERAKTYFISVADTDIFSQMTSSNIGYPFFKQLLRGSDKIKKEYYRIWTEFMQSGKLDELIEYCDDYFQYVEPSFLHNNNGVTWDEYDWWSQTNVTRTGWGDGGGYATTTKNAKNWLKKRANYIYNRLTPYDLSDDIIDPNEEEEEYGQPDRVSVAEVMSQLVDVYSINGILIRKQVPYGQFNQGLMPGIYIVNGKKYAIR